jgi:hypothetical protein
LTWEKRVMRNPSPLPKVTNDSKKITPSLGLGYAHR